jgi:hypothetical protein
MIGHAEAILPSLIADMVLGESLATTAAGSSSTVIAFDMWVERSGEAPYTHAFLDGEAQDRLIMVSRSKDGEIILA